MYPFASINSPLLIFYFKDRLGTLPYTLAWAHLVHAEGGEHIPGAHLAAVLVAAKTIGLAGVEFVEYLMYILLRLFGLSEQSVKPGGMMRRLIAMSVHADKPCNIGLVAPTHGVVTFKETVKESYGLILAANVLNPRVYVVWHIGAVLPTICLGEVVVHLGGFEGRHPSTVAFWMGKAVAVNNILPALATYPIFSSYGTIACNLSHLGNAPVIVGILQCLAYALIIKF